MYSYVDDVGDWKGINFLFSNENLEVESFLTNSRKLFRN